MINAYRVERHVLHYFINLYNNGASFDPSYKWASTFDDVFEWTVYLWKARPADLWVSIDQHTSPNGNI
jgi:hypothetical protein